MYSRYIYAMNIDGPNKRARFLKEIKKQALRFLAYKTFVNILSCQDFDRNIRYILPSCVVSKIRDQFPNVNGEPYTGFISFNSTDGQALP